jgi:hypothetical protein
VLVSKLKPDLLSVSASAASPPVAISRYREFLMRLSSAIRIEIVFGGSGAWRSSPNADRVDSFQQLRALLSSKQR